MNDRLKRKNKKKKDEKIRKEELAKRGRPFRSPETVTLKGHGSKKGADIGMMFRMILAN